MPKTKHTNNMQRFLDTYRAELIRYQPWARDHDKLARFMSTVEQSLYNDNHTWNPDHNEFPAYHAACIRLGFDTAIPLKGLKIWIDKE